MYFISSDAACRRQTLILKPFSLALALALGGLSMAASAVEQVQPPAAAIQSYDLSAGPLDATLTRIARQAGKVIIVDPQLVKGLTAGEVRGELTLEQAFAKALQGTGLELTTGEGGTLGVKRVEVTSALPAVRVKANVTPTATTEGNGSYATGAVTIGRMEQTLREIPQSVSVVTRQQIEDENLTRFKDTVGRTTGVFVAHQNPLRMSSSWAYSRGFSLSNRQFDGVPMPNNYYSLTASEDTVSYDRIEVIRGSAGLLQGTGDPSGVVNHVRKKPGAEFAGSASAFVGSWNHYRGEVDVGGPLNDSGTIRGRTAVSLQDRDSFIDTVYARQATGYGVAEADLSARTLLTVGAVYADVQGIGLFNYGLPRATDGSDLKLSRSWSIDPAWTTTDASGYQVFTSLEHGFDNGWKVKLSLQKDDATADTKRVIMRGAISAETGAGSSMVPGYWLDDDTDFDAADLNISGTQTWWGREHQLLLGVNWNENLRKGFSISPPAIAIDNYFLLNDNTVPEPLWSSFSPSYSNSVTSQHGVYGSMRLRLTDPLALVLGSRVSWWENSSYSRNTSGVVTTPPANEIDSEITPYLGVIYDLNETWSGYASYADIFNPQTNRTVNGDLIDPVIGANYELGIKGALNDGLLNVSLAAFRIEQTNRAQEDINNPCVNTTWCYVAEGEVRSQGVEGEMSGELMPGWQAMVGYTFNTNRYVEDRNNADKTFNSEMPEHLLRAATSYRLPGGWERWTVGAHIQAQSDTFYETGGVRASQGGYTVVGLRTAYQATSNVDVSLNVNNLFDKGYYNPIGWIAYGGNYGDPRNVMLAARIRF